MPQISDGTAETVGQDVGACGYKDNIKDPCGVGLFLCLNFGGGKIILDAQ